MNRAFFEISVHSNVYKLSAVEEEDREPVTDFLASYSKPFYRNGHPLSREQAAEKVDHLIRKKGLGYLLYQKEKLIGLWTIEQGLNPHALLLSCQLKTEYEKQGITMGLWKWTVKEIFKKQAKALTFADGKPFEMGKIQALVHPLDRLTQMKLILQRFRPSQAFIVDSFKTDQHDGKRILFEIDVDAL